MAVVRISGFGLSLFFVLSAFLICDLLLREKKAYGSIDIGAFYKRRVLRIWPLYLFGLILGWIVSRINGHPETTAFLWFFFVVGNWYTARIGWFDSPMTPLWSISIEEQFYLFWPAAVKKFGSAGLFAIAGLMIGVANAMLIYFAITKASLDVAVWSNSFVQFEMFGAGILVALCLGQRLPSLSSLERAALFGGSWIAWTVSGLVFKPTNLVSAISPSYLIAGFALIAIGCALFLISLLGIPEHATPKWVAYLGRISYGLYVYHGLSMYLMDRCFPTSSGGTTHLLSKLGGLALTVTLAATSYKYLESPFLRIKSKIERIKTRPV
jgi:peptidoglycan/LPS O-acetylase OafA/YrhL